MVATHLPANPAVNYGTLKTELQTNPKALAAAVPGAGTLTLSQMAEQGCYQDAANLLDAAGASGETLLTGILPVADFQARVVAPELLALTASQRDDLHNFLDEYQRLYNGIPLNDPGTWTIVTTFFPASAPVQPGYPYNTNTQLAALKSRACSRAEALFGAGVALSWTDVAQAWNWT